MTNKELLKSINRENKEINRNFRRLCNIGLIGILGKINDSPKASGNTTVKRLAKIGLGLVAVSEILIMSEEIMSYKEENEDER